MLVAPGSSRRFPSEPVLTRIRQPGDRIADVGPGTGVFLGPFAAAVGPTGRVYAVDIKENYLLRFRRPAKSG
jgi:ubiquinone/menaquinone biosynthesis C-methylase UbiE